MKISGLFLILLAATLWATLGVFYKSLMASYALSAMTIVFFRAFFAVVILLFFLAIFQRRNLTISRGDWYLFLLLGLLGIAGFFVIYINAIALVGMGIAAVLMYTAPIWVTLYSIIFLAEPLDGYKAMALVLSFLGVALISNLFYFRELRISWLGLAAGIGAGIGYAIYILLNKAAAQRLYSPWTINVYSFALGALFLLPFQKPTEIQVGISTPGSLFWLFLLGLVPTLGAGVAFNAGLHRMPASNASIVATFEPLIATLLGWMVFREQLTLFQLIGGILILSAVILLQLPNKIRTNQLGDNSAIR